MESSRYITEIRRATPGDALAVAVLLVSSWRHAYRGIMPDDLLRNLDVEKRADGWRGHLEKGAQAHVLVEDQRIIGVVETCPFREALEEYRRFAEIPLIYLQPERIGLGHGRRLMEHAIGLLASANRHDLALWVLEKNRAAIGFHERMGFENCGETKVHEPTGLIEQLYIRRGGA